MEELISKKASSPVKQITVLTLSALGDLILALPLIGKTRQCYPEARLTLVCLRPATAALARELGVAEAVVLLPSNARRAPLALVRALLQMRVLGGDLVLQTFSSHGAFGNLIAGATGTTIRCGFANGRFQRLLTHRIPLDGNKHLAALNMDLLRRLGHWDVQAPTGRVLPKIEGEATAFPPGVAREKFGRYAAISIGSDPILTFKRWPAKKWADLCLLLAEDGTQSVFVGAGSERTGVEEVIALMDGRGVNLAGKTNFADLVSIIAASRVVVATDGMLLHLASSMQKTAVGLFGPTHPDIGGPWGHGHEKVWLGLPCSPCYGSLTVGQPSACKTRECLQAMPVSMVHQSIRRAMAREGAVGLPLCMAAGEERV